MTVTHSKGLTTLRKRQKRKKTLARLAKQAEKAAKQGSKAGTDKPRKDATG